MDLHSQGSATESISAHFTLGKQGDDSFQHLGQTNTMNNNNQHAAWLEEVASTCLPR